jgi:dynein heavy chain
MIHGAYLEGCKWDTNKAVLGESDKGVLFVIAPVIDVFPIDLEKFDVGPRYRCPMYKSTMRQGQLDTTGLSTNFIKWLFASNDKDPDHWIRRGVALICVLND